jgi:predicted transcriptional regulator
MVNRERWMFKDIIGDIPVSRILDFLLLHPHTSHTLAKIVEGTNLNFRTTRKRIENLVNIGIVEVAHEDGKSRYYIINLEYLIGEFEKMGDLWRKY